MLTRTPKAHRNFSPSCLLILYSLLLSIPLEAQQNCQPAALTPPAPGQVIFTEQQEIDLGGVIAEHLQRNYQIIDDEETTGYLRKIGENLLKHL